MFLALILLCAGISLNAMTNDMEKQEETKTEKATSETLALDKEETAPITSDAKSSEDTEDDFEIDLSDEEIEE